MLNFTPDQWIIVGLVFLLGFLVGVFMVSGSVRKWKERYKNELERREALEADYKASEAEWRERDSLRAAALRADNRDDPAV
ncbi:clathrin light chain [Sphingomicrobium flavum]|uniref:clathrin light chain n=1 Tax=Sphingomicrobium flavum TaxID=1229164 RepID=UPI0021AD6F4F|nr:clathrin light chain [Sphingomicrobium flavum]